VLTAELSTFLETMSHELMAPLNAIGGYAAIIEMGLRVPVADEQRADLARIRRSARRTVATMCDAIGNTDTRCSSRNS
jgi:signal transduction histidine kinase